MEISLNLKQKSDDQLVSDLKDLVIRERALLVKTLQYLKEIEIRKIYLAKGHSSMFAFLTDELQYSEGAAQRRIQAMRLIKELPQVEKKIESGKLSLTVASQVQGFIQREDKKRRENKTSRLSPVEKLDLVQKLEGTSARTCERKLAEIAPETGIPKEKIRILSQGKVLIQFVADSDIMNKIERLRCLLSHQNPEGKLDQLFSKALEIALEKLDPILREERRAKRGKNQAVGDRAPNEEISTDKNKPLSAPAVITRYIPNRLRDQVWKRDSGRCQFKDKNSGRVCGSRHQIQVDHLYPFGWGGKHSEENLRLLCGVHNRHQAQMVFS